MASRCASSSKSQMPTGSFKDRGTAVMLNHLIEVGVGAIHENSSGNAGSSIATYAAAAGLACRIYVPVTAPRGKIVQIAAMGADIRVISGSRQGVTEAALGAVDESFYASHNWQPFFIEGTKTLAYELWEQFGFAVPDNILVPTGYGSNILGLERGFDELERRGEIEQAAAALCGPGRKLRRFCRRLGGRGRGIRAVHAGDHRRRRHRRGEAGAHGGGAERAAPVAGWCRRRAGSRDRPGTSGARPSRPFRRADRGDGCGSAVAAVARRHDPARGDNCYHPHWPRPQGDRQDRRTVWDLTINSAGEGAGDNRASQAQGCNGIGHNPRAARYRAVLCGWAFRPRLPDRK